MDWKGIPAPVRACCEALWGAGHQALPVGGCVRDSLLGRTPGDWDVTTSARPEETMALFAHTVPTGIQHGTVTVLLDGMALEVTTFRGEAGYSDGRHPDAVTFGVGLTEDLARRDFTVNAMALAPDGGLVDPFGGQADLERRLIRCVGDPDRRFREDGLRLLRAVRFAAQLGFGLEEGTREALARNGERLDRVSGERVKAELEKILLSPQPELAALPAELGMLARFGVPAGAVDLSALGAVPGEPIPRWTAFCKATGLDITKLPVERALRRAVLHPELAELDGLALTGGALYAMGFRGGEISAVRRRLLEHVRAHPEDNEAGRLAEVVRGFGRE